MTGQDTTQADAIELENILIVLERLGSTGAELALAARRATAAIVDVVSIISPIEVDVTWDAEVA